MRKLPLLFLMLVAAPAAAQKQGRALIDSLINELPQTANDTAKGRLYRVIADECFFVNVDQALHYSRLGLRHTTRMKWQRGIGVFNSYLGRAYSDKGNYDSCRYHFLKAIAIYKDLNDTWNLASTTNNLGVAEQNIRSDYPAATRYYFEGLRYAEATGDNYLIGLCLDNISEIYRIQHNFPKALQFGERALALRRKQRNPDINARRELGVALTSMAALYTQMKDWPKARSYGFQALAAQQQVANREGIAKTYGNLATAMLDDYPRKIAYAQQAKQIWDSLNPHHLDAVSNLANLGWAYTELVRSNAPGTDHIAPAGREARLRLAESYLSEAIRYSTNKGEVGDRAHFRGQLAELQALRGNYKGAYENFRAYRAVEDSLYSQENKNRIAELEGKREIELRDKELQINRLTIAGQRRQQIGLLAGVVLLAVIGLLLYRQSGARQRTNARLLQLNQELDNANQVKTRFFAILSHDLRSPVANLISFLNLQRTSRDLLPADQMARHEQNVTDAAEGLLETMESMLLWSKSQMQQFGPAVKVVSAEAIFESLQRFFAGTDPAPAFHSQPGLRISTDEDFLRTILQNLTSNAIKALKGIPGGAIRWTAAAENGEVVLTIRDNGPGLSEAQLQALHTGNAPVSGKSGLGLHLIRDLAQTIQCGITVRSSPGEGTEFRLTLPQA